MRTSVLPVDGSILLGHTCAYDPFAIIVPVAIHQAAHAVVTALMGWTPRDITIPTGGLAGSCDYLVINTTDSRRSLRDIAECAAIIVIAGPEGEAILATPVHATTASDADARIAMDIITAMTDSGAETEAYAAYVRARASYLLSGQRAKSAVFTLADMLIDDGQVSGRIVIAAVAEAMGCEEGALKGALRDRTVGRSPGPESARRSRRELLMEETGEAIRREREGRNG
jgi:hypothetical protein